MLKEKMTSKQGQKENLDLCIADIKNYSIYSFSDNYKSAEAKLIRAISKQKEEIENWTDNIDKYGTCKSFEDYLKKAKSKMYKVMDYKEYKRMERDAILGDTLTEITGERYNEMLNILPPKNWTVRDNIEMFYMAERFKGTYTSQYLHDKINDKYYTKMIDVTDSSTSGHHLL